MALCDLVNHYLFELLLLRSVQVVRSPQGWTSAAFLPANYLLQ